MTAQVIFSVKKVFDQAALVEYRKLAHPTITEFGGRILSGFSGYESLEGNDLLAMIIVEFPDRETAQAWFHSKSYRTASLMRKQGSECTVSLMNCEYV